MHVLYHNKCTFSLLEVTLPFGGLVAGNFIRAFDAGIILQVCDKKYNNSALTQLE